MTRYIYTKYTTFPPAGTAAVATVVVRLVVGVGDALAP